MSLSEIKQDRLKKLELLKKAGIDPYPAKVCRTHKIIDVLSNFDSLEKEQKKVILAGRIIKKRDHGGSCFANIRDESGLFQLFFNRNDMEKEKFELFKSAIDLGDFLEAEGLVFKTKTEEKTLKVLNWRILAKTLMPLPDKWHGLQDHELRFRSRYLDLLLNDDARQKAYLRSKIICALREFLRQEEFLEVETPILQEVYGGASARPFKTYHQALGVELFLRIAPELYLKRLLVGGLEKIYEIGRNFRNEGIDSSHNPEFTMLELYWSYADYEDLMTLTEKMFQFIINQAFGRQIEKNGLFVSFLKTPWPRISYQEAFQKYTGLDYQKASNEDLLNKAKENKITIDKKIDKWTLIDELVKKIVLKALPSPIFLFNHPIELSPLAKKAGKDTVARFQLIFNGIELVNAFSELNDPQDQEERFCFQAERLKSGEEGHPYDKDFISALKYGMPPAAGLGMGIDRLVAMLTNSSHLREVILFPLMKPRE